MQERDLNTPILPQGPPPRTPSSQRSDNRSTHSQATTTPWILKSPFADGQLYVALSRLTSIDGLVLTRPIVPKDLHTNTRVRRFLQTGATHVATRGRAYIGVCMVGDVGSTWRPRPVELAVVTDDGQEFTTLVNPERDLGAARQAYGVTAGDVQLAPTLAEAWGR